MAASPAAEAAVKKLARLPCNTICPNCGTQKKYGFSTVCIKYLTFVCNMCKSSHQAVSHRCKSLTMSAWSEGEVLQLKRAGNDKARSTWLAGAPPVGEQGRPKEGDSLDRFKAFILDVYERKKYYAEGQVEQAPQSRPPAPATRPPAPARPPVAPPAAPAVDLLDFGDTSTVTPTVPVAMTNSFDAFGIGPAPAATTTTNTFDAFGIGASSTTPPAPVAAAAPTNTFDAFGTSAPVGANTFDAFGGSAAPATAVMANSFDAFGGSTAPLANMTFDAFGITGNSTNGAVAMQSNGMGTNKTMSSGNGIPTMNSMGGGFSPAMPTPAMSTQNGFMNPNMPVMMQQGGGNSHMMMQQQQQQQGAMNTSMLMQQQQGAMSMQPQQSMPMMAHAGMNGMQQQQQQPTMSTNMMASNSITSNFGGTQPAEMAKRDPFADLNQF